MSTVEIVVGLFVLAVSLPLVGLLVLFIAHVRADRREQEGVMAEVHEFPGTWTGRP